MLKKINILKEYRGGDGRYRPGPCLGAIETDWILWLEHADRSYDNKSVTTVHFDNGSTVDVIITIKELMELIGTVQDNQGLL